MAYFPQEMNYDFFAIFFCLKSPLKLFTSFSSLIKWFFEENLGFILFFCVLIILSTFGLLSFSHDVVLFVILL